MKHVTEMIVQRIKPIKMEITKEVARDDPMNIITGSDNARSKDHAKNEKCFCARRKRCDLIQVWPREIHLTALVQRKPRHTNKNLVPKALKPTHFMKFVRGRAPKSLAGTEYPAVDIRMFERTAIKHIYQIGSTLPFNSFCFFSPTSPDSSLRVKLFSNRRLL